MRLSEAIQAFIEHVKDRHSKNTARTYAGHLRRLPLFAARDATTHMGEPLIEAYFKRLAEVGVSQNTLSGAASALGELCKYGVLKGYWPRNPMVSPLFRYKKPEAMPKPFDSHEIARLMALPLERMQLVARDVLYFTGIRVTPLITIRLCDISFAPVRIGPLEAAGTIWTINKGNKRLRVYIVPDLKPVLEAWIAHRTVEGAQPYDPLFQTSSRYGGGAISRSTVEHWVRLWGTAAQVRNAHPHRFRHTYATELLNDGVKIEFIQKLLGHSSIHTTQAYLKVADAHVLEAALHRRRPVDYSQSHPAAKVDTKPADSSAPTPESARVLYGESARADHIKRSNIIRLDSIRRARHTRPPEPPRL